MPTVHLSVFLRRLTRGMVAETLSDRSDRQLVEQFLAERGEAAFEAIVRRHGPMVYRVCWRVLQQEQDAEDAFQATFLLLAEKLRTVRKHDSLASWLHGVARRVAQKAQAQASLRHRHERHASDSQGVPPDDVTWRELRLVLDAELAALPEKWRLPLILCYLEARTQEEAAGHLGWSRTTLQRRLTEARGALGRRLKQRGVVWSAAISAVLLLDCVGSAALPAALMGSTVEAAACIAAGHAGTAIVGAKVVALAEGVRKTMLLTNLKTAAALGLAAAVFAASVSSMGLPVLAANGQPRDTLRTHSSPSAPREGRITRSVSATDERDQSAEETKLAVGGRVLDPDGKPVSGAKLYLGYSGPKDITYPVRATSGDDGRFRFTVEKSELDKVNISHRTVQVMAVADGHGCDWAAVGSAEEELTLRLVKDVPITVRILDADGKPVAGAEIRVMGVWVPKGEDLGGYLDQVRKAGGYAVAKSWDGPLAGQPAVPITGADGRFRLSGAGRERVVHLRVEGPGIASSGLYVMTRVAEPVMHPKGYTEVYGASSDYVGRASRPIRGVVRDKETGKPITGVSVEHYHGQGPSALTDKDGRYELLGLAKSPDYALNVKPADGLYFQRRFVLQDTPGLGALTCDIELVRGLTVRGRVSDKETGKSVAGARVEYYPLGGNVYVDKLLPGSWDPRAEMVTGGDGSYAITVMPGPGVICVTGPKRDVCMPAAVTLKERKDFFKTRLVDDRIEDVLQGYTGGGSYRTHSPHNYNAVVLVEPDEKDEALVKDVALVRPQERRGRVVGPDGQPLIGATVFGLDPYRSTAETLKGDEFTVRGVNPKANRPLVVYHKDKNLGFYLKDLRDEQAGPLTIKLQRCGSASGRVLDQDGQPVAALRLHIWLVAPKESGRAYSLSTLARAEQVVTTDKDGRFRAEGLVPGLDYAVSELGGGPILRIFAPVVVEPGKHKDMGEIKPDPRIE
jgi:RNA polymerase sigma factor (sigma-70 family)